MSQKRSGNICSYREDSSQEIKLYTSQLHSAPQPRFWKGRNPLALPICVSSGSRRGESSPICLSPSGWSMAIPCLVVGNEGTFQSLPSRSWSLLCACLTGWLLSSLYTSNICWAEDGVICFSILIFPYALSSFGVCILKPNARPHLLLQQQLWICLIREREELSPDGSLCTIYLFWPCVSQIAFS